MQAVRGIVLHCGRFGCVVRLEDGRLANLPATDRGHGIARRVLAGKRRPEFTFLVVEEDGWPQLQLASAEEQVAPAPAEPTPPVPTANAVSASTPLDEKIIEYLRQTADWDPKGAIASRAQENKPPRADRLLPFEMRARRQYRDTPKKPPRKKR